MGLSIVSVSSPSSAKWDAMWQACDQATFSQSRAWAEIWSEYHSDQRLRPDPRLIKFSDGREALIPLSRRDKMFSIFCHYLLCPAGTFGSWLTTMPLDPEHTRLIVGYVTGDELRGSLKWRLSPYVSNWEHIDVPVFRPDETLAISLEDGFDAIHKRWTKGHRSAAKKAAKAGVKVRIAESREDWAAYYEVYLDSTVRWGSNASGRYAPSLFDLIRDRGVDNVKLWLAEYEGKIIAGALCLYSRKHVGYWHGASLSDYLNVRPANLLMFESIRHACEHNYAWFDFNPSAGLAGVRAFKKSFGAKSLPAPIVVKHSSTRICLSNINLYLRRYRQMLTLKPYLAWVERWRLRRPIECTPPQLFILGLPRSGTTLIYQYIVHRLNVAYFTHGVGRYPGAASMVTSLQRKFTKPYKSDFRSSFGKVKGANSPREAGSFWARAFGYEDYVEATITDPAVGEMLRRTVASVQRDFGDVPFVNKNVKHLLRIRAIANIFPNAYFLIVERDLRDIALSILRTRHTMAAGPDAWWSVKPPNYRQLSGQPPAEQVVGQLKSLQSRAIADFSSIPSDRVLHINYKEFCDRPESLIADIEERLGPLKKRNPAIEQFTRIDHQPGNPEEQSLISMLPAGMSSSLSANEVQ
jgi:hypothetical protein